MCAGGRPHGKSVPGLASQDPGGAQAKGGGQAGRAITTAPTQEGERQRGVPGHAVPGAEKEKHP